MDTGVPSATHPGTVMMLMLFADSWDSKVSQTYMRTYELCSACIACSV